MSRFRGYTGDFYEDRAVKYLKRNGYKIIERNYRTRFGEIDIIAKKGKTLVFVEVKGGKGEPRFRVDERKMRRIELTANDFLSRFDIDFEEIRFDVIEITEDGINHIEGVSI